MALSIACPRHFWHHPCAQKDPEDAVFLGSYVAQFGRDYRVIFGVLWLKSFTARHFGDLKLYLSRIYCLAVYFLAQRQTIAKNMGGAIDGARWYLSDAEACFCD